MKRFLTVLLLVLILVLELLPWGVAMHFASPNGSYPPKYYSYFDLLPWGYGNIFPILTAIMTVVLLILEGIRCFLPKNGILTASRSVGGTAMGTSLLALVMGGGSLVGAAIALLMLGLLLILCFWKKL